MFKLVNQATSHSVLALTIAAMPASSSTEGSRCSACELRKLAAKEEWEERVMRDRKLVTGSSAHGACTLGAL